MSAGDVGWLRTTEHVMRFYPMRAPLAVSDRNAIHPVANARQAANILLHSEVL